MLRAADSIILRRSVTSWSARAHSLLRNSESGLVLLISDPSLLIHLPVPKTPIV